ncbi:MAG: hypothetical protein A2096_08130 [Spirochaetes bacterium GWF1_41_5]|nr:MAG: hypothetical protein A2096_08130 [Spirochaetes bacterium GWF1_41_5]HBE04166.1 hypothetical protein [Spirochaetia bacterium]
MSLKSIVLLLTISISLSSLTFAAKKYESKTGESKDNPAYTGKGGETSVVTVKGISQIQKAGEQDAFDRAKEHALRLAVEQVLGTMITSETKVQNSTLIEDNIMAKSAGFVNKYEVISDSRDGNTKIVELKAWVVLTDVKNSAQALGLLQKRMGRPRVLVLINEKSMAGTPLNTVKTTLHTLLSAKEFTFVDEAQLNKVLAARKLDLNLVSGADANALAEIAVDAGAQIIMKGQANAAELDLSKNQYTAGTAFKTVAVSLSIDVINAADATVLASGTVNARKPDIAAEGSLLKGLQETGKLAADDLLDKIVKKWDDMLNNGIEYDVTISGVTFQEARAIKGDFSKNIEGVKDVADKGFANNVQKFIVKYTGMAGDLAGLLTEPGKSSVKLDMVKYDSKSVMLSKIP